MRNLIPQAENWEMQGNPNIFPAKHHQHLGIREEKGILTPGAQRLKHHSLFRTPQRQKKPSKISFGNRFALWPRKRYPKKPSQWCKMFPKNHSTPSCSPGFFLSQTPFFYSSYKQKHLPKHLKSHVVPSDSQPADRP